MTRARPTVTLPSTLVVLPTGGVRLVLRNASQTMAISVRIRQAGGRLLGGSTNHSYLCIDASRTGGTSPVPLTAYGRSLVHRDGHLRVTLTLRLTNGSGVTNTESRSAVIRPER